MLGEAGPEDWNAQHDAKEGDPGQARGAEVHEQDHDDDALGRSTPSVGEKPVEKSGLHGLDRCGPTHVEESSLR